MSKLNREQDELEHFLDEYILEKESKEGRERGDGYFCLSGLIFEKNK